MSFATPSMQDDPIDKPNPCFGANQSPMYDVFKTNALGSNLGNFNKLETRTQFPVSQKSGHIAMKTLDTGTESMTSADSSGVDLATQMAQQYLKGIEFDNAGKINTQAHFNEMLALQDSKLNKVGKCISDQHAGVGAHGLEPAPQSGTSHYGLV